MAQRREQLLQIKAAKDTKVAHAMAKKQGSVGEDEEAVAIASLLQLQRRQGKLLPTLQLQGRQGRLLPGLQLQGRQSYMLSGTEMKV